MKNESQLTPRPQAPRPRPPVLIPFLAFVFATFIGILIYAYVEAKKANPQMIQVGRLELTHHA